MFTSLGRNFVRHRNTIVPISSPLRRFCVAGSTDALSPNVDDREAILKDFDEPAIRSELNKLREVENDIKSALDSRTTPIDWDSWRKEIAYPDFVDEVKEIYDSVPPLDVEEHKEKARKKVDEVFDPIISQYEALSKEAEAETIELEKKMDEVTFLRDNIQNLSVEEFLEKYPAVRKSLEDDIKNNRWFVDSN